MKRFNILSAKFEPRFEHEKAVAFDEDDFQAAAKVQIIRLLPEQRIKPHRHAQRTELFHVVAGQGEIRINGQTVVSSPDELVLCQPGDVHEFINTSAADKLVVMVFRTNDGGDEDMIWEKANE